MFVDLGNPVGPNVHAEHDCGNPVGANDRT